MNFISIWAQGIIISVIIVTIIEMILPEGSNGKYIKMIAGVFILFTIISPIINKISSNKNMDLNLESYIDTPTESTTATSVNLNNEDIVKRMYEENLKIDIKTKVNQKGYVIGQINLEILDNDEYTLNKIYLKIIEKDEDKNQSIDSSVTTIVENIENIKVNIGGSKKDSNESSDNKSIITETEKRKLKEYLSGVYEVNEKNILIE